ncbi:hypothetical protein DRJ17_02975 [Candidatus Woesearchaeota archaeon]|nr:MAG: hypothetical protein DRJ17_02975 [Candidatus Woesearchaeota archaeon]
MGFDGFIERINELAKEFKKIDKNENIRIVSHLDADGISAAALLIKLFDFEKIRFTLNIIEQLDKRLINEIKKEKFNVIFFTDLGSGNLDLIQEGLAGKKVFVIDHHEISGRDDGLLHVNPHLFGLDGNKSISGAGVVYFFAKAVNEKIKDFAHIAVIGAIGDVQEDQGFEGMNSKILTDAVESGKLKIERGLRLYGLDSRPIHKVLEYSSDIKIPGVSGSESASVAFLQSIGIKIRNEKEFRRYSDLSTNEKKRLAAAIILKRADQDNPEDIFGNIYVLPDETEGPLKNAKEFATLLNSCGRLNRASFGIGALLNDKKLKKKALDSLKDYRRELVNALNWYRDNRKNVITNGKYMIINAEDNVMHTIIGTLGSMISKSGEHPEGFLILTLAQSMYGYTKASLRVAGQSQHDLREIIKEIATKVDGDYGGHMQAAGALFETEREKEFIKEAMIVLDKKTMEEIV